jgi:hypothetical protein
VSPSLPVEKQLTSVFSCLQLQETAALNAAAAHLSKRQRDPNISSESPYMSSLPSPYYGVTENQSIPSWPTPKTSRENSPGSSAVQGPATPPFAPEEGAVSDIRCVPSSSNASHFSVLSDGGGGSMQGGATDGDDSGVQYVRTHDPYSDQYPKFEEVPLEQAQEVPQGNSSAHPFSYSPTVASRRSVHMAPFQPRSFVPSTERFQAAMPEPGSMPRGYETPWVPTGDAAKRASGMSFESGRHRGGQLNRLVQMERAFRVNRKRTQTFAVSSLRFRYFILGSLYPSRSGLLHKHIVKHIVIRASKCAPAQLQLHEIP